MISTLSYVLVSVAQHYLYEIHLLLLQIAIVCSFSLLQSTPLYDHTTVYPVLGGHLGYSQFVAIMSNVTLNIFEYVF